MINTTTWAWIGGSLGSNITTAALTGTTVPLGGLTDITWQETLPNLLVIRGLHFHMQALVLDAAANGFGATTSNALEVHVGF